jgi:glycosyltransferase involved in cell wall biosynthesis
LRLLIIGSGSEACRIRALLTKPLKEGTVHIEPDIDHRALVDWYRAMDLCVMPSRYENFSNALLEAMACGIPFLASNVGGNRMFAESGAGWLFESESISSLCSNLCMIMDNPCEINARGKTAARYANDCHSWSASAERLEKIFLSLLETPR